VGKLNKEMGGDGHNKRENKKQGKQAEEKPEKIKEA
jgi:hypothetical protein